MHVHVRVLQVRCFVFNVQLVLTWNSGAEYGIRRVQINWKLQNEKFYFFWQIWLKNRIRRVKIIWEIRVAIFGKEIKKTLYSSAYTVSSSNWLHRCCCFLFFVAMPYLIRFAYQFAAFSVSWFHFFYVSNELCLFMMIFKVIDLKRT